MKKGDIVSFVRKKNIIYYNIPVGFGIVLECIDHTKYWLLDSEPPESFTYWKVLFSDVGIMKCWKSDLKTIL